MVEGLLTSEECDIEEVGRIYKVTLVSNIGITLDAFEDELYNPIVFTDWYKKLDISYGYTYDVAIQTESMRVTLSYDSKEYNLVEIIATKPSEDKPIQVLANITLDGQNYSQVDMDEIGGHEAYTKQIESYIDSHNDIYYF